MSSISLYRSIHTSHRCHMSKWQHSLHISWKLKSNIQQFSKHHHSVLFKVNYMLLCWSIKPPLLLVKNHSNFISPISQELKKFQWLGWRMFTHLKAYLRQRKYTLNIFDSPHQRRILSKVPSLNWIKQFFQWSPHSHINLPLFISSVRGAHEVGKN